MKDTIHVEAVAGDVTDTVAQAHVWLQTITDKLIDKAPELISAVLILIIGKIVADILKKITISLMTKSKVDHTLIGFTTSLGHATVMVIIVIAALSKLGFQTTSFVAILGAAGLAIGLALQGSLSNFAAGVLMIVFKPFKVGDFIEGGGVTGSVEDISIFTTIMTTPDNKKVIVPNAKMSSDNIINFGANGTRRVDLSAGISYSDDMQKTKELLLTMLKKDSRVLKTPAPVVGVTELGDSSVNLVVRPWCKAADYWDVHFDMTQAIKETLDANDISIPFPQRDIHHYYPDGHPSHPETTPHALSATRAKEEEGDE